MMEYLLLAFYLLAGYWLIPKLSFIKDSNLSPFQIRLLYALKILVGIALAIYVKSSGINGDYTYFQHQGIEQYHLLLKTPSLYLQDFIIDARKFGLGRLFETNQSFWGYLSFNLLYKLIGIINIFSLGNFYTNTLLFSSAVFFAHVAFYKVYSSLFPQNKKAALIGCFLLPSTLVYTSCVHKDGFVFLAMAAIVYGLFQLNKAQQSKNKLLFVGLVAIGMTIIFLFRNYILLALLPALLSWWLSSFLSRKKILAFVGCYAIFILLFFLSAHFYESINLPQSIINRKTSFENLTIGNTTISTNKLEPNALSFIKNLPQALNHVLLRPYVWEYKELAIILTALEVLCYVLIFLLFIIYREGKPKEADRLILFGVFLFISMVLIIGYTIPNIGAIIRYRSIFWILVVCPALCSIDWAKLKTKLSF